MLRGIMDAALFRAALGRLPRLTGAQVRNSIAQAGSLESLAALPLGTLSGLGWPSGAVAALRSLDAELPESDLASCQRHSLQLLAAGEPGYPDALLEIDSAPPLLYVRGQVAALSLPQLAIVGSRNPTGAGRASAREFAEHFARTGLTITSGLASGIDSAAHEGALAADSATIAVCATGLDSVYPGSNKQLADRIVANGALVSEFPPGTPPRPENFPQRNRLISGLSIGVLVVEAARRSGSLITARCAGDQGRDVFAIPGSIHSPQSHGCHQLIRTGAKLVESAQDVLEELRIPIQNQLLTPVKSAAAKPGSGLVAMDKDFEILLHALGFAPASLDQLVARTGLATGPVASMLLMLELQGEIEVAPGGRYRRLANKGPG
jgi:DNA processing protein